MARSGTISSLTLQRSGGGGEASAAVCELARLSSLDLHGTTLGKRWADSLPSCQHLYRIVLVDCTLAEGFDFGALSGLAELRWLDVNRCKIGKKGLFQTLLKIRNLEVVNLVQQEGITNELLETLRANSPKMKIER